MARHTAVPRPEVARHNPAPFLLRLLLALRCYVVTESLKSAECLGNARETDGCSGFLMVWEGVMGWVQQRYTMGHPTQSTSVSNQRHGLSRSVINGVLDLSRGIP